MKSEEHNLKRTKRDDPFMGNAEPNLTPVGKTNMTRVEINKMLSLLCLLNVYKTSTTVTQTTEMKASSAEKEEQRDKNKLRK